MKTQELAELQNPSRFIVGPKIKTERADESRGDYTAFLYPWNDPYRWSGVSYPRD
jgi:hypothetical protein